MRAEPNPARQDAAAPLVISRRDLAGKPCNKREPGRGCAALQGYNRLHTVLDTREHCIATHRCRCPGCCRCRAG